MPKFSRGPGRGVRKATPINEMGTVKRAVLELGSKIERGVGAALKPPTVMAPYGRGVKGAAKASGKFRRGR